MGENSAQTQVGFVLQGLYERQHLARSKPKASKSSIYFQVDCYDLAIFTGKFGHSLQEIHRAYGGREAMFQKEGKLRREGRSQDK
jgi:hypothetical protein